MVKRLRRHCLIMLLLVSALTVICGVLTAAEHTQEIAFGTGQALVAAKHTEQRLDIGTPYLHVTVEVPYTPQELLHFCAFLPFPLGNLAAIVGSAGEVWDAVVG